MQRTDRAQLLWGERTPYAPSLVDGELRAEWPARVDEFLDGVAESAVDRWVPAASLLHSDGDAMDIAVVDDRIVGVRGRAQDRVNRGRLDVKDRFGWRANSAPDRLTTPLIRDGDRLVECDWDTAMNRIVERSKELLAMPGGWGRFGFYTSGQLFLEEYYTLGVIGKAGIGTPHMDGNTRLCTATAAAALKASFGTDGQPAGYDDVDLCDALAFWGHNVAETQQVLWAGCSTGGPAAIRPRCSPSTRGPRRSPRRRTYTWRSAQGPTWRCSMRCSAWSSRRAGTTTSSCRQHTLGFDHLSKVIEPYTPAYAAEICGLARRGRRGGGRAAGHGTSGLVSTVLQGFYQSQPGDRGGVPGQHPAPAPRDARPARAPASSR